MNNLELAKNPNNPVHILEKLADDEDWWVRYQVAKNPNTPVHILEKLADDEYIIVRCCVAEHPNTPEYIKDYILCKFFVQYTMCHFIN